MGAIALPHTSHFPQVGGVGAAPQDYETYRDLQVREFLLFLLLLLVYSRYRSYEVLEP